MHAPTFAGAPGTRAHAKSPRQGWDSSQRGISQLSMWRARQASMGSRVVMHSASYPAFGSGEHTKEPMVAPGSLQRSLHMPPENPSEFGAHATCSLVPSTFVHASTRPGRILSPSGRALGVVTTSWHGSPIAF